MKKEKVVVITNGLLESPFAKTCHGLLRGSERFEVLGVIDHEFAGMDAGMVMENRENGIPIYANLDAFFNSNNDTPKFLVIGIATPGGVLPDDLLLIIKDGIKRGLSVVNGLHTFVSDDTEVVQLAKSHQVELIDIRKPRPRKELSFWSGTIFEVQTPKIAVLGMDCAVGKRTTCRFLTELCNANEMHAEMIYTGQTGWMQGSKYGFILDSTVNDFVSGELERAIVACARNENPDVIFIEGQSALQNPTGPCGSEIILSGNVKGVILQHVPGRAHYEDTNVPISPIEKEIQLIELLGAKVIGITLNEEEMTNESMIRYQVALTKQLGIPVVRPLKEGVTELLPVIKAFIQYG